MAQNTNGRCSAIDGRTTRHVGYATSLKIRAWIETHFGRIKGSAGLRQVKQRGLTRVDALFQFAMAASNLVRLPKLMAAGAMKTFTGKVRLNELAQSQPRLRGKEASNA